MDLIRRCLIFEIVVMSQISCNEKLRNLELSFTADEVDALVAVINVYFKDHIQVALVDNGASWREMEPVFSHLNIPVRLSNELLDCLDTLEPGSVSQYPENKGIIFNAFEFNTTSAIFPLLSKLNPLARIIVVLEHISTTAAEELLQKSWSQFKLLNLMIVSTKPIIFHLLNPYNATTQFLPLITRPVNVTDATTTTNTTDTTTMTPLNRTAILINDFVEYRRNNLQLFPLKVNAFDTTNFCKITGDGTPALQFHGICNETVDALKKAINCSIELVAPHDDQEYGFVDKNGTYLGSLGEVEYGRVDVAANVRLIANFDQSKNLLFIHPLYDLKYCFVAPAGFYEISFEVLPYKFIDFYAFIMVIVSMAALIIVEYVIQCFNTTDDHGGIVKVTLMFFSLYCNVSTHGTPTLLYSRMLYATMLLATIILTNCFQGSIIQKLNEDENSRHIETMSQLLDSNLVIRVPSGPDKYIRDFADFPKGSIQRRLFDQKIVTETMSAPQIKYVAITREAAVMVPNHFIFGYQMNYISNDTGQSMIHPVPECVYAYHMSIMLQKSSPFIEKFNFILQRTIEIGIVGHQYRMSLAELSMGLIRLTKAGHFHEHEIHLVGMKEMKSLFVYYLVAMGVAVLVLIGELFLDKLQRRHLMSRRHQRQRTRDNAVNRHRVTALTIRK